MNWHCRCPQFNPTRMQTDCSLRNSVFRGDDRIRWDAERTKTGNLETSGAFEHEVDSPPETVLIVDDDPAIRSTLVEALRDWGYRAREAGTLAETLVRLSSEQPAAVLLDIRLPDGSGISILDEIQRRSPETVVIVISGYLTPENAFAAGLHHAYGVLTKPFDETEVRGMLAEALAFRRAAKPPAPRANDLRLDLHGKSKRGRPRHQTSAPLGSLVLGAMKLLGLSYRHVVAESEGLARLNNNPDMRIGKSTLGNIISGSIRQPGTAKLDSLRTILNISRSDMDAALGLQPERGLAEQLELPRERTHEVSAETVLRRRGIKIPIVHDDANLNDSQLFKGAVRHWATVSAEYLSAFFPPHCCYVVVGDEDNNASPIAPPGSRLLVNTLLNEIRPAQHLSYHERELYYVMTPRGFTCGYLEHAPGDRIVLLPHPLSGNVPEEYYRGELKVIGQVMGVLYPR